MERAKKGKKENRYPPDQYNDNIIATVYDLFARIRWSSCRLLLLVFCCDSRFTILAFDEALSVHVLYHARDYSTVNVIAPAGWVKCRSKNSKSQVIENERHPTANQVLTENETNTGGVCGAFRDSEITKLNEVSLEFESSCHKIQIGLLTVNFKLYEWSWWHIVSTTICALKSIRSWHRKANGHCSQCAAGTAFTCQSNRMHDHLNEVICSALKILSV